MRGIEQKTFAAMAGEHVEPANSDADTASTPGRPDAGGKSARSRPGSSSMIL
jgi:hypothetical protein